VDVDPNATYPTNMIRADQRRIGPPRVMRADPSAPGRRKDDGFSLNVRFCYGLFDKQTPQKIHKEQKAPRGYRLPVALGWAPRSRSQFPRVRVPVITRRAIQIQF